MSTRTTAQKMARALQRLTEDEIGARPKLTTCHNIIRDAGAPIPGVTREERVSALYLANAELLKSSASRREAERADTEPVPAGAEEK